jgi:peptidoglycan/LPS O-acetylase OafA/YrhL
VLTFHAWLFTQEHPSSRRRDGLLDHGLHELRLGLFLFFVLSGYLLYAPWVRAALGRSPEPSLRRYLRRRAARILPAYYAALAGSILLLYQARGTPGVDLPDKGDLWLFAVFGQNFSRDTLLTLNTPLWTLAVEVCFYLALPLLGLLAMRGGRRGALLVPMLTLVAGLAWNATVAGRGASPILTFALPAMLPYFACGMLVRALIEERRLPHAAGTWALALAGVALVAADALWHETSDVGFLERTLRDLPAAAGFALVLAAIRLSPAVARPLGREPLAHLGLVSYGVYLWHVPLMLALRSWGLLPLSFLPGLAVALLASVAVASVSWVVLERPVLNRVRAGDVARA